jgi:hypothetical protein
MTGDSSATITVQGQGRELAAAGAAQPMTVSISDAGLALSGQSGAPVVANFRDLTTIAVDQGRLLLVLGGGAVRYLVEGLGERLGLVVSELRERRARQMLHDRFIEVPDDERLELVEYRIANEHGVGQLAYHARGVGLLPLDERNAWRLVRRADIASVIADASHGQVTVSLMARPGVGTLPPIELVALGSRFEFHRSRIEALRTGSLADAAAIVARLLPDAPFSVRQVASAALVDGRPVSPATLGEAWPYVERAVLVDQVFAATYRALVARGSANGSAAPSWLALTPKTPAKPDESMAWFLVGLPGNLVALELVSEGAHATYLYRVVSRAKFSGAVSADALTQAVLDVSECLIDTRFLREPIYLTDAALLDPRYTRYRFAIAALPTLRAARWRFVGRLIHTDDASWAAALEDAIKFNSATTDDAAVWPGGATQETD